MARRSLGGVDGGRQLYYRLVMELTSYTNANPALDGVFAALADPTRRALLDKLFQTPGQTLSQLVDGLGMRRQSASRHLQLLEDANLVVVQWHGREKRHYLNAVPIAEIQKRWIDKFSREKTAAIVQLKTRLERDDEQS